MQSKIQASTDFALCQENQSPGPVPRTSAFRGRIVRKNPNHIVAWDRGRWKQILAALWAFWRNSAGLNRSMQDFFSRCKQNLRTASCCWHMLKQMLLDMFQPSFSNAQCELLQQGQSWVLRISPSRKKLGFSVWKQSNHASKKRRALMKHSGGWLLFEQHLFVPKQWHYRRRCVSCRWLLFEQHLFVPKHVTLSQKMPLALLVSIPASCFFDQQAAHDKNSKRGILAVSNWDWKISKQSLSISEHCKKTARHTKWPYLLEPFSSFLHVWPCRHQVRYFHACRGQICQFQLVPVRSPRLCADTSPKLEVSTPCPRTKRTREDAILKGEGTCFNPHFPRQSVNCYGQDNRGCCEYRLPEKNLDFLYGNRVTMQARSGELWWSTLADDSYSSSIYLFQSSDIIAEDASLADDSYSSIFCLFQSMWHYRRRCL